MAARLRADVLLVARGLAGSRTQAQALILAGKVTSGDRRIEKPGVLLGEEIALCVASTPRFVSRGGDKLDHALAAFKVHGLVVAEKTCLDIGASTGGFTDCLLQHGATRVFAVDVGYGQLAQKLRTDPRVEVRERVNARNLQAGDFDYPLDLVVVDASFIGIGKLMEAIARVLRKEGDLVVLIKPQFEVGREAARRGRGVIRDETERMAAIEQARRVIEQTGFAIVSEVDSALRGPKGNIERFVHARKSA